MRGFLILMSVLMLLGSQRGSVAEGELAPDSVAASWKYEGGPCANSVGAWEARFAEVLPGVARWPSPRIGHLQSRESLAVDRDILECRTYCPGVGLVLEQEDYARIQLIEYERF